LSKLGETSNPTKSYLGVIQQHLMTNVQGAKKEGLKKLCQSRSHKLLLTPNTIMTQEYSHSTPYPHTPQSYNLSKPKNTTMKVSFTSKVAMWRSNLK
jgi:hypothetical protein